MFRREQNPPWTAKKFMEHPDWKWFFEKKPKKTKLCEHCGNKIQSSSMAKHLRLWCLSYGPAIKAKKLYDKNKKILVKIRAENRRRLKEMNQRQMEAEEAGEEEIS